MTGVERADGERNEGVFPKSWGRPQGEVGSEQRASWVAGKVRRIVLLRREDPAERRARLARRRLAP